MATRTGIALLSALRKSASTSALRDIPEEFFVDAEERAAFEYLKAHVASFRTWPTPQMIQRDTGIVCVKTTQSLEFYINEAKQRALYNSFLEPFGEMRTAMENMNPEAVLQHARDVISRASALQRSSTDFIRFDAALNLVMKDYEEAALHSILRGIPTPWDYLNEITGGWQQDDLISIVGRPGVGKTYILLLMAYACWRAGYNTLFVSNELGALQLARRLFGIHTRVNPDLIRKGRLSSHVYNDMLQSASALQQGGEAPFNIIAGGLKKSVQTVTAVADATNPDAIFCDASYLLQPEKRRKGSEGRREMVSDTIEDLKRLALDLHRPVIQSVQFNRNVRNVRNRDRGAERVPHPTSALTLENIAETDVIGQASSVVAGFCKALPPRASDQRWGKLIKGREGEEGVFLMNYQFSPMNFDIVQTGFANGEEEESAEEALDVSHMI